MIIKGATHKKISIEKEGAKSESREYWSKFFKVISCVCHMCNLEMRRLNHFLHGNCPGKKGHEWACLGLNQANLKKAFLGIWGERGTLILKRVEPGNIPLSSSGHCGERI